MIIIVKAVFLLVIFLSGLLANNLDDHLKPEKVHNFFIFNLGKILSYTVVGIILGLLGFILKINGFTGGILLFLIAVIELIVAISHIPLFPKIIVIGLRSHHHPQKSFFAGLLNVFASAATLHIVMIVSLAHGYYIESGIIMAVFALGSIYFPSKKIKKQWAIHRVLQFFILILGILFTANKALLYSEKLLFNPLEYRKTAVVPELMDKIQYVKSNTTEFSNRIVISSKYELNWLLEGNANGDTIYIPRFKHKSKLNTKSEFLYIDAKEPGFIYFTGKWGQGDYAIKVIEDEVDVYNLPYAIVMDSGYNEDIHGENLDVEIPEIKVTDPGIAEIKNNKQYVTINITSSGYTPSVVVLKSGVPAVLNFVGDEITEKNKRIIMPSYNEYLEFSTGDNPINIPNPLIDFLFYSWKGDFGGYVLIVEDLDGMTKEKAERQVRMLNVNGI